MKQFGIAVLGVFFLTSSAVLAATATTTDSQPKTLSKEDQLSYSMGVVTGKAFKSHGVQINTKAFAQGLSDALSNSKTVMTDQQMQQTLQEFQAASIAKAQAQLKAQADQNLQEGDAFLAKNAKQTGVKTTQDGLQYKVIEAGSGNSPGESDIVVVNYEGRLVDGTVFDSSYKTGKPVTFPVNAVIQGWQEALKMMKPGATWEIVIPPKLAYGELGAPDAIGPNETLIFKVNLISVQPPKKEDEKKSNQ